MKGRKEIDILQQKISELGFRIEGVKSKISNAKLELRSLRSLQSDLVLRQRKELELNMPKKMGRKGDKR